MADTYIVNHTLLGTGQAAGEVFPVSADGKTVKDTFGNDVPVDLDRLLGLFAVRKATDEEKAALDAGGALDPSAVFQGDAPEGQRRVSSDTFAAVGGYQVTYAGPDQSAVSAPDQGAAKPGRAAKSADAASAGDPPAA